MTPRTPRPGDEGLLLARVSAAAGRADLGRRSTTHRVPDGRRSAGARLDFYERGMTVAVRGRIRVVRYDTTRVRPCGVPSLRGVVRAYALDDVEGRRFALRWGDFDRPEVWVPGVPRAVVRARVPPALEALAEGERLVFGPVRVTRDQVAHRSTPLPWTAVQRTELHAGRVAVRVAGRWRVLGSGTRAGPDPFVLHALAEHLTAAARTADRLPRPPDRADNSCRTEPT